MKYHTRQRLKEAWTEDMPWMMMKIRRKIPSGCRAASTNRQTIQWVSGTVLSARQDMRTIAEFGIYMNRKYYQRMKDFLISLGVKVLIVCSNLLGGAADVYGHIDGDIMENDSYFQSSYPTLQRQDLLLRGTC